MIMISCYLEVCFSYIFFFVRHSLSERKIRWMETQRQHGQGCKYEWSARIYGSGDRVCYSFLLGVADE